MWRDEHLKNVSVPQRVPLSNCDHKAYVQFFKFRRITGLYRQFKPICIPEFTKIINILQDNIQFFFKFQSELSARIKRVGTDHCVKRKEGQDSGMTENYIIYKPGKTIKTGWN